MKKIVVFIMIVLCLAFSLCGCGHGIMVEGIEIKGESITIQEGDKHSISFRVLPLNASNQNIEWTSENEDVVTVKAGTIYAKSQGDTVVRARSLSGNFSKTLSVNVVSDVITVSKSFDKQTTGFNVYKFDNITSAVASSKEEDTIIVLEGEYDEHVIINKSLKMHGNKAKILGSVTVGGNAKNEIISDVEISGFEFLTQEYNPYETIDDDNTASSIYINRGGSKIKIFDCTFINQTKIESENSEQINESLTKQEKTKCAIKTATSDTASGLYKLEIYNNNFYNYDTAINFAPLVSMSKISANSFYSCVYAISLRGSQRQDIYNNYLNNSGFLLLKKEVMSPSKLSITRNDIESLYKEGNFYSKIIYMEDNTLDKSEKIEIYDNDFFGQNGVDMTEGQAKALYYHIYEGEKFYEKHIGLDEIAKSSSILTKKPTLWQKIF